MTGGAEAKNRLRVGPVGRAAVLVTVAVVTALVPVTALAPVAAAGQARSAGDRTLVAGDISTVAGGKRPGPARATSVAFSPCGVSVTAGTVYAAAGQTVRQVSQQGVLTTPAGTGSFGPLGDGGLATRANLENACGTAVDGSGNLLIADGGDFRIRAVAAATGVFYGQAMTAGDIYTIAGGGPISVAVDGHGNLVICDEGQPDGSEARIRVAAAATGTFYGIPMTAGDIYTVAGGSTAGFAGDGGPATSAELNGPRAVAVNAAGDLVIADAGNNRIRQVTG
jgi:trimeric autotransporter adhesin